MDTDGNDTELQTLIVVCCRLCIDGGDALRCNVQLGPPAPERLRDEAVAGENQNHNLTAGEVLAVRLLVLPASWAAKRRRWILQHVVSEHTLATCLAGALSSSSCIAEQTLISNRFGPRMCTCVTSTHPQRSQSCMGKGHIAPLTSSRKAAQVS
jgi:hypothetical protein